MGCAWSCTHSERKIIKTINRGVDWSIILHDSSTQGFSKMRFLDTLNGFLIDGCLNKTTDGGNNWINTDSASTRLSQDHFFINKDTGWTVTVIGYNSYIKQTINGGVNWSLQYTPITSWLYSIYFINELTGWTVGANGTILKTNTGGLTFIKQISTLVPDKNALLQNYPNPFNPTSKIKMEISKSSAVRLIVYDALGKKLTTLVNEQLNPGTYEVEFNGIDYPSGVYFYQLKTEDFIETRKMLLLK